MDPETGAPSSRWCARRFSYLEVEDDGFGGADSELSCVHQARHAVLLARLQKPYLVYCVACSLLASVAFVTTLTSILASHQAAGGDFGTLASIDAGLEGDRWQSSCWAFVGLSLCAEFVATLVVRGPRAYLQDRWAMLDAVLVLITVLAWALALIRRFTPRSIRDEAEELDLTLLALRFAMQPCRVVATLKAACHVKEMQMSNLDIEFEVVGPQPPKDV